MEIVQTINTDEDYLGILGDESITS